MNNLLISIVLGAAAGIIDIIPMILQKLDGYAIASAFVQWLILGLVINYLNIGSAGWLRGMLIAVILALPIIILVMKTEPKSVFPILIMSAILGSAVGYAGDKLLR